MLSIKYYSILFVFIFPFPVSAQELVNVDGEYIFVVPNDISINEAESIALQGAKLDALSKAFGTVISQDNISVVSNTDSDFFSLGYSSVKGEWIETIGEPEYIKRYENNQFTVIAKVFGVARDILESKIDVAAKVLRNGIEDKFESDTFKDGDDLFVSFASPVDGYLSIYLVNQNRIAYCLLPYISDVDGAEAVVAGERSVFFSTKSVSREDVHLVDEYSLTSKDRVEYSTLYFIFSPNKITKALDAHSDKLRPRQLHFLEFERWLVDLRINCADVQVEKKIIHISQL